VKKLPYCESLRIGKDHQQSNPIGIREQALGKNTLFFLMMKVESHTSAEV